ncbi:gasdermin-A2-like [Paramormyrops kingsleyae]|uniref:gasdermin-A2-like n=1 Tax=Paramormyrops kingsleyae TaxID=1676925 RepID=UPI003B971EAF
MFKDAARNIVKELDPRGELKPVVSAYDSKKIDVLTVVKIVKTSRLFFFYVPEYHPTPVSVADLILRGDTVDFGGSSQLDVATVNMKANAEAALRFMSKSNFVRDGVEGSCTLNRSSDLFSKLESVWIDYTKLHRAMQDSKFDDRHPVIMTLKKNPKVVGLGVIFDVLKTKNPLYLKRNNQATGSAKFSLQEIATADSSLKVESTKTLNVDAGSVLGFKLQKIPLDFVKEDEWVKRHIWDHDGVREFTEECLAGTVGFSQLKQKVENAFQIFRNMDDDVKIMIWSPLCKISSCARTLHVLDRILEEGFLSAEDSSILDSDAPQFLSELRQLLSMVELNLDIQCDHPFLEPLNLLVSSLNEIDEQGVTLISRQDPEVRRQVLNTVEQVLENVFEKTEGEAWSRLFGGSNANEAKTVLQACGVILDETNPYPALGSPGVPDITLISLYIALKGLSLLLLP